MNYDVVEGLTEEQINEVYEEIMNTDKSLISENWWYVYCTDGTSGFSNYFSYTDYSQCCSNRSAHCCFGSPKLNSQSTQCSGYKEGAVLHICRGSSYGCSCSSKC